MALFLVYAGKEEIHKYYAIWSPCDYLYLQDRKSKESTKMALIWKLHITITKYLMCRYTRENTKFLCLALWLEGCAQTTITAMTIMYNGQSMIVQISLVVSQMRQKVNGNTTAISVIVMTAYFIFLRQGERYELSYRHPTLIDFKTVQRA